MKYCPFQSKSSLWSIATKWLVDLFERCCVQYSALVSVAGRLDIQQQQYLDQAWWGEARAVELIHNLCLNVNWSNHSVYLVIYCYFHVDAFWWASTCKEENFTLWALSLKAIHMRLLQLCLTPIFQFFLLQATEKLVKQFATVRGSTCILPMGHFSFTQSGWPGNPSQILLIGEFSFTVCFNAMLSGTVYHSPLSWTLTYCDNHILRQLIHILNL